MTPNDEAQQKAVTAAKNMLANMNPQQRKQWDMLVELSKNPESAEWKDLLAKAGTQSPAPTPIAAPTAAAYSDTSLHSPLIVQPTPHNPSNDFHRSGAHEVIL